MAKRKGKRFTRQDKFRIVHDHLLEGKTMEEVCAENGINPAKFETWKKELRDHGALLVDPEDFDPKDSLISEGSNVGPSLRASFISVEDHDIDLIIAIALQNKSDPMDIDNLLLHRTPSLEVYDPERANVSVRYDRDKSNIDYFSLRSFELSGTVLAIRSSGYLYRVDLSKVDPHEIKDMKRVAKMMNFDKSFSLKMG